MKKTSYPNAVSEETIKKAVYENSHSTEIESITLTFTNRKGNVWKKTYSCLCMNEEYWCIRGWNRYGLKTYGAHYSWNNVTDILLNKYKKHEEVTFTEIDPTTGKVISETPMTIGVK